MKNRLLVVDDEPGIRLLLNEFLTMEGFRVDLAKDGEQALRILEVNASKYECILTDIHMPGIDGISLGKFIFHNFPELPVIAITGDVDMKVLSALVRPYFTSIVAKPFDLYDVLSTVRDVCSY
jgi:two-component system response regulator (stage 0 sporulation protein F)